jgi:hypothetical protein
MHSAPRVAHSSSTDSAPKPKEPDTEAIGQDTGEMPVVPGTPEYREIFEKLWKGKITYDEFFTLIRHAGRAD